MIPPDQKDFARIQDLDGKEQGNHITPRIQSDQPGSASSIQPETRVATWGLQGLTKDSLAKIWGY